jgi:putative transcriptional regulator
MKVLPHLMAALLFITPASAPAADLTGQLLVAVPDSNDPNFDHTVVFIVAHDIGGAFGLVINEAVRELPMKTMLEGVGLDGAGAEGSVRLHAGGPVEREKVFVLHSAEYRLAETMTVGEHFAVTNSVGIFRDIAAGKGPRNFLIFFGYAGWAPGQLDREMAEKRWFTAPADPKLVFEERPQKIWDEALGRRVRDL